MNTKVNIAGVEFKNPVMEASGTFGSGAEYSEFVDLNKLGAVVTKGVANVPWPGNPTPRIAETYGGMLNAIGLQNPGFDLFAKRDIPFLKQFDTKIIVNVCGHSTEEYIDVVEKLGNEPVDMLEINISCPNVKEGGIAFGQDPKAVEAITKEVKKVAKQPIIMKAKNFPTGSRCSAMPPVPARCAMRPRKARPKAPSASSAVPGTSNFPPTRASPTPTWNGCSFPKGNEAGKGGNLSGERDTRADCLFPPALTLLFPKRSQCDAGKKCSL